MGPRRTRGFIDGCIANDRSVWAVAQGIRVSAGSPSLVGHAGVNNTSHRGLSFLWNSMRNGSPILCDSKPSIPTPRRSSKPSPWTAEPGLLCWGRGWPGLARRWPIKRRPDARRAVVPAGLPKWKQRAARASCRCPCGVVAGVAAGVGSSLSNAPVDRHCARWPTPTRRGVAISPQGLALVAQGIEHRFPKPEVAGSNPAGGT